MSNVPDENNEPTRPKIHPFRRAVLRGLGVVLPPLLTIVVFLWAWNLIQAYVLEPVEGLAEWAIVSAIRDVRDQQPPPPEGNQFVQIESGRWISQNIYKAVEDKRLSPRPQTADAYYREYVRMRYLKRSTVIPLFLAAFILVMYFLGKFLAAGVGRWTWLRIEGIIHRLPIIRNVYSSVKQVTDFIFSEQEIQFNRVVAVEYPRKGMWSIGFVTGESMLDIRSAANEPVLSVLMPTSPMPMTGFTITVRKSETVDLNISIDQAIQFVVSCGVVVPRQQLQPQSEIASVITSSIQGRLDDVPAENPSPAAGHAGDGRGESPTTEFGNSPPQNKSN